MKLPSLPKPKMNAKPKPAKAAGKSQVRTPRALEDLYRDMRDRRLLLPALVLLVAIAAGPIALSAPKEEPPAPLAYTPPAGSEAVAPAVLTEQQVGVRDYRERLDQLKSKNPFASNFSFPEGDGLGGGSAGATPVTVDPSTAPSGGSGIDGPGIPNNDTGAPTGPGTPTDPPVDTGAGDPTQGEILILAPRIDVNAGPVGKRKRIKNIEIGDLVPDRRKAPIAIFLGAGKNLEYANFLISADVTETTGDGHCRPRANSCEFLRLREDEKRYFTFGPDEERFSIKVSEIREKIVDRRKVK